MQRRKVVAVGLSFAVHGAVAAWVFSHDAELPRPPRDSRVPFEVSFYELPERDVETAAPPIASTRRRGGGGGATKTLGTAQNDQPTRESTDVPRAVNLTPNVTGQLIIDTPTTELARVSSRVDAWARSDVIAARTSIGLIAPEFEPLGRALKRATADVPRFINTNNVADVSRAVIQGWAPGAERYGKTGQAYEEPAGRSENTERPTVLQNLDRLGDPRTKAALSFFSAGARLQEFADGRAGATISARVELKQHADGALQSVTMLTPSGNPSFDRWVLEQTRTVAEGWHFERETPARTVWRFEGVLTFRRKIANLKDLTPRAMLGLITMSALSALSAAGNKDDRGDPMGPRAPGVTGRFDETSGALDVVDLTNPTWACKVSLLEAQ